MHLFSAGPNRHYSISIFSISAIPCQPAQGVDTARQLCSDAYHLCNGTAALSAELLRIADTSPGAPIRHLLILRCTSNDKTVCRNMGQAFFRCGQELLNRQGYLFSPLTFQDYLARLPKNTPQSVLALMKGEIREGDELSTGRHVSLPVFGKIDLAPVYAALDGSGCTLSIQMTPQCYSPAELAAVHRFYASCSRAADGSLSPIRDGLANFSKDRWRYYVDQAQAPAALTNVIITGPPDKTACIAARLKSALTDRYSCSSACMQTIDLSSHPNMDPRRLPWQYEHLLRSQISTETGILSRRLSAEEVSSLMAFPCGRQSFTGLKYNPFSLLRRDILFTKADSDDPAYVPLGKSHVNTPLCLPLEDFPLHIGIFGKSGFGKTTLQLNLLDALSKRGISTLVLEPVKREYRSRSRNGQTKVFTVEYSVAPFFINPFLPPEKVTLREYKPHLLQAFQAAFSMPDPLPSLFARAVTDCYALYNWRDSSRAEDSDVTHFGLSEFIRVFQDLLEHSRYSGDIRGNILSGGSFRLSSLLDRCKLTFETIQSVPMEQLLRGQTVLELGRLEGDEKCLVSALTLISALAYLRITRESGAPLQNVLLLDEAHVLLDAHSATAEGMAANHMMSCLIANLQAEMRALGVSVILADQSPGRIGSRLLDNCDTRILFRLTGTQADMAAHALGLTHEEHEALTLLDVGQALISNHRLNATVGLYTIPRAKVSPVSDGELHRLMSAQSVGRALFPPPFLHCSVCTHCQRGCHPQIREWADMLSVQIYRDCRSQITNQDTLIRHLLTLPDALHPINQNLSLLCRCTAVHLYRMAVSNNPALGLGKERLTALFHRLGEILSEKEVCANA